MSEQVKRVNLRKCSACSRMKREGETVRCGMCGESTTLLPLDLITPLVEALDKIAHPAAGANLQRIARDTLAALPELKAQEGE